MKIKSNVSLQRWINVIEQHCGNYVYYIRSKTTKNYLNVCERSELVKGNKDIPFPSSAAQIVKICSSHVLEILESVRS